MGDPGKRTQVDEGLGLIQGPRKQTAWRGSKILLNSGRVLHINRLIMRFIFNHREQPGLGWIQGWIVLHQGLKGVLTLIETGVKI